MARIELKNGVIKSLSGKLGNMIYRTLKSGKIVASFPSQQRSTPLSNREVATRRQFACIASEVARRMRDGDKRPRTIIWHEVESELNQN